MFHEKIMFHEKSWTIKVRSPPGVFDPIARHKGIKCEKLAMFSYWNSNSVKAENVC